MTNDANAGRDGQLEQELAGLKAQYEKLKVEKVRAEQNLENLAQRLAELEEQARTEYGTSEVAALEKLLAERRAENETLVREYREHLEAVGKGLAAIESDDGSGE